MKNRHLFSAFLILLLTALPLPICVADEPDELVSHLAFHLNMLMKDANGALDGARAMKDNTAKAGSEIAQAREAYWAAYPNGKNLPELGEAYAKALTQKDMIYLSIKAMDKWTKEQLKDNRVGKLMDKVMGAGVDGGIAPIAQDYFDAWVARFVAAGSGGLILNWAKGLTDPNATKAYDAYRRRRDVEEYFRYCPSSQTRSADPAKFYQYVFLRGRDTLSTTQADADYRALVKLLE